MRLNLNPKSRLFVFGFFILFVLNAAWLGWLQHSDRSELHSSPFYPVYLSLRGLALKPLTVFGFAVVLLVLFWNFFREGRDRRNVLEEIILIAAALGIIFGYILTGAFKL